MIFGNIFLGMGIGIFKVSGLGNDPFSGMVMALADLSGIHYANFQILLNIGIFALQFFLGREFIGIGTFINAIFLGYIATFFYNSWLLLFGSPGAGVQRVLIVCLGVVICSFGISLYQTPNVGVAPYDSLSLIMTKRFQKIPYFWNRMLTDGLCTLICFLTGGIVGLGTLVSAFGFGPFIHFFNKHFTEKLLKK